MIVHKVPCLSDRPMEVGMVLQAVRSLVRELDAINAGKEPSSDIGVTVAAEKAQALAEAFHNLESRYVIEHPKETEL